jgi:hypothetical protein
LAKITLFCYIYFNFTENILHFCNCGLREERSSLKKLSTLPRGSGDRELEPLFRKNHLAAGIAIVDYPKPGRTDLTSKVAPPPATPGAPAARPAGQPRYRLDRQA